MHIRLSLTLLIAFAVSCGPGDKSFGDFRPAWNDSPISVSSYPAARGVRAAVEQWNSQVDCAVFIVASQTFDARVVIEFDVPPSGTDCGRRCDPHIHIACTCYDPGSQTARIYYPAPGLLAVDTFVVTHELGHVLGLVHDVSRNSVMRRAVHKSPGEGRPLLVTHNDRNAVRAEYCP